jgi:hypothetical protein
MKNDCHSWGLSGRRKTRAKKVELFLKKIWLRKNEQYQYVGRHEPVNHFPDGYQIG